MKICKSFYFLMFLAVCCQCNSNDLSEEKEESKYNLEIDPADQEQVIHNFGASDAWACQFVGKNWPEEKRKKIADLLFSTKMDAGGNPNGIGLSLWRFNIGAGTAGQGTNSDISDEWRRAESFLNTDGSYDWEKQQGQQWFLTEAKNMGVDQFVAFVNSPPVSMTRNGKGYSYPDNTANLKESSYDDFAEFMAAVVGHFNDIGIPFTYISPVNEPQWNWDSPGQEGSSYRNEEIFKVVSELNRALSEKDLDTKIELPEAGRITDLYQNDSLPERNNQLEDFFDPTSNLYVGDLSNIGQKVAAHGYFTTYPEKDLKTFRRLLKENIDRINPGLEFWMSEYCLLENNPSMQGGGRDLSMDPALYLAKVIHYDLTMANASAWHWWLAVSPYDYKDGLIYIDNNKDDGQIYASKMLWTLGNYSRFIRPGMKRIKTNDSLESEGVLISAYTNTDQLVVVITNMRYEDQFVHLKVDGSKYQQFKKYLTSNDNEMNLTFTGATGVEDSLVLPARSVMTLVSSD